ncbi:glycosyltransferase family 2 protein [Nocardia sp. NPDC050175]|uniref:glycosyltransferase family 2 protein n=1 Tax=Nocardia sp. NPDC050175 TaxID=3364317 RepID=UPI0037B16AC5
MPVYRSARIDIVCPTFNRSSAIRSTIDSVLAQTVEDWTLLVVSDGSTDDTDDIVRGYRDPRVRLLRVGRYGHPGGPRNMGVAAATAPFVAYIDHDDRWLPTHLAVLLDLLEGGSALAATGCVRVNEAGKELDRSGFVDLIWHPEVQTINAMFEPSRVGHMRTLLADVGGWTTTHAGYEDWDLWFRSARYGHDFNISAAHTAVLTMGSDTRRNGLRAAQAVVMGYVDSSAAAELVLHAISSDAHRTAARASYLVEILSWYASLVDTSRFRAAAEVVPDLVETDLRRYVATHEKPCLLEELSFARTSERWALLLPLWCTTGEHAHAIGCVLRDRFPGQYAYLAELIGQTQTG